MRPDAPTTQSQHRGASRHFTLGDIFAAGGGFLVFVTSFLPFVTYDNDVKAPFERSHLDTWWNAWRFETFMAPLTWFVALGGLLILIMVLVRLGTSRPITIATFSINQLELVVAAFITLIMFGYATSAKSLYFGTEWARSLDRQFASGVDFGIGGYLMLAGGIIALVGAALNLFRIGPNLAVHIPQQHNPHAVNGDNTGQFGVIVTEEGPTKP